jgi:hypothetical protein
MVSPRTLVLALLLLLLLAAPAAASPSFRVDTGAGGDKPDLWVNDAGTARVAWIDFQGGAGDVVRYCVVPRGATSCAGGVKTIPTTMIPAGTAFLDLAVKHPPGSLFTYVLVSSCCTSTTEPTYVAATLNDTTFSAWAAISNHGWDAVTIGSGSAFSLYRVGLTSSVYERSTGFTTGGGSPATLDIVPPFQFALSGAVGIASDGKPLVMAGDVGSWNRFRKFTGSDPTNQSQLSNAANWSPAADVGSVGDAGDLTNPGPAGLLMLMDAQVTQTYPDQMLVRKFNTATNSFGAPVNIAPERVGYEYDIFQQVTSGVLYAVWRENENFLTGKPTAIRMSKSTDGGASWTPVDILRENIGINSIYGIHVGAAADQQGFVVFEGPGVDGSHNEIRMSTLDALPPYVPPSSGGGTGTTGGGPSTPTAVSGPAAGAVVGGAGPAAKATAASVTIGGVQISFLVPSVCVPPGANANLRVTSKDKRRLGKRGHRKARRKIKIKKVTFYLDTTKQVDKKAAFKASFSTASLAPGSRHTVKAKVLLKKTGKRRPFTRTLRGTISIC